MSTPVAIIIIVVCAVIFCIAGFVLGSVMRQKANEKEIGSATQEATKIINDALQQAEHTKKPALSKRKMKFTSYALTPIKKSAKGEAKFKNRKTASTKGKNILIKEQIPLRQKMNP